MNIDGVYVHSTGRRHYDPNFSKVVISSNIDESETRIEPSAHNWLIAQMTALGFRMEEIGARNGMKHALYDAYFDVCNGEGCTIHRRKNSTTNEWEHWDNHSIRVTSFDYRNFKIAQRFMRERILPLVHFAQLHNNGSDDGNGVVTFPDSQAIMSNGKR